MINILFVGAGRRVGMARLFKNKINCRLYSYEQTKYTPISDEAKVILGLDWEDNGIVKHLQETIDKYDINLCIPFYDQATLVLNKLPFDYRSICVCADEITANECINKKLFADRILSSELAYLYPFASYDEYPKISKPINGCGSRGIQIIKCKHEDAASFHGSGRIIQKYIEGAREFTVDFYVDIHSNYIGCCIRKRLRVAGGEVQDAVVVCDDEIESVTKDLTKVFVGLKGPNCVQYLRGDKLYITEINARFGGGAPLSIAAGFDMIKMIEIDYINREPIKQSFLPKIGTRMVRSYRDHFFIK